MRNNKTTTSCKTLLPLFAQFLLALSMLVSPFITKIAIGEESTDTSDKTNRSSTYSTYPLSIVSSSTTFPLTKAVESHLFKTSNSIPTNTRIYETDVKGGINLFCSGSESHLPSMLTISRSMKKDERVLCEQRGNGAIAEFALGYIGIVIIKSADYPLDLSTQQLWDYVSAEGSHLRDWPSRGEVLQPFKLVIPSSHSTTRKIWEHLVMYPIARSKFPENQRQIEAAIKARTDGTVIERDTPLPKLFAQLEDEPETGAAVSLRVLNSSNKNLTTAGIDGARPTFSSIREQTYPLSRPVYLYLKTEHLASKQSLLSFVKEFVGSKAISDGGYLAQIGLMNPSDSLHQLNLANIEKLETNLPQTMATP